MRLINVCAMIKKQEIFQLFELLFEQVFTVPLEERRFKEMNENSFGDEGQTEQAKICKEIMAKHGKFLCGISSLIIFIDGVCQSYNTYLSKIFNS